MEYTRAELMPGVFVSHLRCDKFKTACLSVTLLTQLKRENAAMNALIPSVLRRGTARYGDMEKLAARLDELYGAAIEPVVRRVGEIHCVGFFASFAESAFVPGGEDLLGPVSALMAELLLAPNTRGGLLLPQYVDSERDKLLDLIRSRVNNKRSYAVQRCLEEMCCCEDYAVSRYGDETTCEAIHYKKLTRYYRELLRKSPVEIFYCGQASVRAVSSALRDAFSGMPRGEIDWEIGTDLRMNALEEQPRYVEERMDVTQGNLVMGYRLGECMEDPDIPALYVFNAVFGSGATSKLFMNVREKLSLCYYASSALILRKGLMVTSSGIAFENFERARREILAQLDAVRNGEVSDEELEVAKRSVASDLRALLDSPGELEGFWLAQALDGLDYGPAELAGLAEEVTKEQVVAVAKSVVCDLVYFLRGEEQTAQEEDESDDEN